MPAGYVIAQLRVTNPENYKEYIEKVNPIVKKFDGEFLVRNGEYQIFDGETKFPRIIILKFPSYERALEWYNSEEYKPIKQIRLDNAEGTNIIIKGFANKTTKNDIKINIKNITLKDFKVNFSDDASVDFDTLE